MSIELPYFDELFRHLREKNQDILSTFGNNVHWGYWENPDSADVTPLHAPQATDALTEQLVQEANLRDGQSILDVGSGLGGTVQLLNRRFKNLSLLGINIDPRQVAWANQHVAPQAMGGNQIKFIEGDACVLPFPQRSFDRVFAVECIFHFPSRKKFFQEVHRVLRPGGKLVLSDFITHGPTSLLMAFSALPYLSALTATYGKPTGVWLSRYRLLAKQTRFRILVKRDITFHTLPTYQLLDRLVPQFGTWGINFQRANRFLHFISKRRWLRYYVLAFERI